MMLPDASDHHPSDPGNQVSPVVSPARSPAATGSPPSPPIDVAAERARTLWGRTADVTAHHLNAAGASLPTVEVVDVVTAHLRLEAEIGGYEAAASELARLDGVYGAAASLIGASADDIALVESATVGWARFIDALRLTPGQRAVVTRSTYVSSALHLLELARDGLIIDIAPIDGDGRTDLAVLAEMLRRPTALLAATHVPTSSGLVEPVVEIGALARAAGVTFLLDATQSVGQLPIDVTAVGCDALVTTGRKFLRAPRGTGILYVASAVRAQLRPGAPDVRGAVWSADRDFQLRDSARRFETWETSHALRLGLGQALSEAGAMGVDRVRDHVVALAARARIRLAEAVPNLRIADPAASGSGIVTFVCDGEAPARTLARLAAADCHGVVVPAGHGRWDLAPRGLDAVVRLSFHVYNDDDDVDAVLASLRPRAAARAHVNGTGPAPGRSFRPTGSQAGADVIVIGAGIHGRSAAWQLARAGASVLMLERLRFGHGRGSSHGLTRMIRRAYPSTAWTDLVDRAYASWAELEELSGVSLLTTTGGIYAHPVGDPGGVDGPGCRQVDAATARQIFPALQLSDDYALVYDPAAGVIDAPAALSALSRLGVAAGVQVHEACPVLEIRDTRDGVSVVTPRGALHARQVVVAAGPQAGALLPELAPSLRVERIVNVHLRSLAPEFVASPALGVFSVAHDGRLLYGIPAIHGAGLKVGFDDGPDDDPSRPPAPVTEAEITRLHEAVRRFLPAGDGAVELALACRYTVTPTRRFAVGPLPGRPRVVVAAACSGHGFKFGPVMGAAIADLVGGRGRPDLEFLDPAALIGASVSGRPPA